MRKNSPNMGAIVAPETPFPLRPTSPWIFLIKKAREYFLS